MICPSCRQEAPENKAFCPYCGAALPPPSEDASSPTPPWMPPTDVPRDQDASPDEPPEAAREDEDEDDDDDEGLPSLEDDDGEELPSFEDDDDDEPQRRSLEEALGGTGRPRAGLIRGLLQGSVVFLVMGLLAAVIALATLLTGDAGAGEIARIAGLVFLGFHHVGIRAEFPTFELGGLPGLEGGEGVSDLPVGSFDISYTVAAALMLGTLLALFLLYRAGRRAAEEGGGSLGWRAVQGASVAIPYAALAAAVAAVVSFSIRLPAEAARFVGAGASVELAPSLMSAALWPLGLAALAGALGGLLSGAPDAATPRSRRGLAIVAGGARMAVGLLLAGFVGLLVLAALSPDMTAAYMEEVTGGGSGLQTLLATVLVLPNLVLWGLTIGMGGSIGFGDFVSSNVHIASLFRFPTEVDPAVLAGGAGVGGAPGLTEGFAIAPIGYFVFIPLTLIGLAVAARRSAQRAGVGSAGEGATAGALSGVVFAAWFALGILLAGIGLRASVASGGSDQIQLLRLGPVLATGALVGLAWGVVVGALGGAMASAGEPRPDAPGRRRKKAEEAQEEAPADEPSEAALPEEEPEARDEELDLAPPPAPESSPLASPPPVVEVGTGPTGFEGLAARRQAILGGGLLAGQPGAPPRPGPEPIEPTEPFEADEAVGPTDAVVPPAEPESREPALPEDEDEDEDEDLTLRDPDQDVPDWLPEALRPEADEIDDADLEARWTEESGEDDEEAPPRDR